MPGIAVEIENLARHFDGRPALSGINLQISRGTLFGLLGPNGGGKTTLLRILASILRPTEGTARILGIDVSSNPGDVRRHIGFVFQEPALDDELTVWENLWIHAALYGMTRREVDTRLQSLQAFFGLDDRLHTRTSKLSGGLKRRTDLVRGLLHSPSLLLLDEPTSGLDPAARHAFWETLLRLREREGITVLVATHLLDEADRCDEIAIVDGGNIVATGTPERLKAELGPETIWLEGSDPEELAQRIEEHLNVPANVIGGRIQVSHPRAHELLPELYRHLGGAIHSATVRRPTLNDVFMLHTGHHLTLTESDETRMAVV